MSSSVKRRKVDSDVPSGLSKNKEKKEKRPKVEAKIQEEASGNEQDAPRSKSPEAVAQAAEEEDVEEAESPKTFKDLVCRI